MMMMIIIRTIITTTLVATLEYIVGLLGTSR
jgi:hypothetical protein